MPAAPLLTVTYQTVSDQVDHEFSPFPVTIVAAERKFGAGIGNLLTAGRWEVVAFLVWHQVHVVEGNVAKPFDGWLEDMSVTNISLVDPGKSPDPLDNVAPMSGE